MMIDSSKLSCRRITCREAWDSPQWPTILKEYSQEVAYPDLPADPDWDMYLHLESAGVLRPIGIFDDGKLMGFANYILYRLPHFSGKCLASTEGIWVHRSIRNAGAGLKLIRALFSFAKEDGAYGIYIGAKVGTPAAKVFSRLARPINTLYWRKL